METASNGVSDEKTVRDWSRSFGDWLDATMSNRNYTDAELARRTGISRQSVGKYRRGVDRPSPKTATRLAEVLGMNPLDVMSLAGYVGDVDTKRSRIADLIRFIPDERLPEAESYLEFLGNRKSKR